jgi:outer membrane protein assembly factor BamB
VIALALALALAQDDEPQVRNTALLKVYAELDQVLQRAPLLVADKRWQEALAIYLKALAAPRDVVVPLDRVRAVGLREFVLARLAEWPEEGKAALQRRVDPAAEQPYQAAARARDPEALEALADDHPLSSFAGSALALAGTLRLDGGDVAGAASALERALAVADPAERPVLAARLGVALARLGDAARLQALVARAEREWPDAGVHVAGKPAPLGLHLRALAPASAGPAALEMPGWEMPAGAPRGWRLAEPGLRLPPPAWTDRVEIPRLDADEEFGVRRALVVPQTTDFRPIFPAVADGVLYVQNGVSVTAYNLFARKPERLWQFKVPAPGGEVMFDNRAVYTVSVHEGILYANLVTSSGGAEDQLGYVRVKFPFARRGLYALDALSGKLLWRVGGELAADELVRNASFAVAPTPLDGRLYAGVVKQKHSVDPFEHYVVCLDAAGGRLLWSTFVASGGTEINLFGNSTRESLGGPVAAAGDVLIYATNHGVIAALDKPSGRIRWTHRYRQLPVNPTRSVYVSKNPLEWISAPPLVDGGVVVVTPTDSKYALGLDAATGERLWERPRHPEVRSIVGAKDGTVVFGGARLEFVDLRSGELKAHASAQELLGTGRGVAASDGIYVPSRTGLRRVGWDGAWDEADTRPWPLAGDGGNLLVVDGAVILARQEALEVYYGRRDQELAIRDALATDPDNPRLLYRAGLRHLQAGRPEEAVTLLARAVEATARASGPDEVRLHRMARKRLFAVSLEAGRADLEARRLEPAVARLTAARAAAPDAATEIEARILLGQAHLARQDDARAVDEFQALIRERGDGLVQGARVFDASRRAIGAILTATGREPYARHEAAAEALLEKARRDRTAEAYRAVFQTYPNSRAAEEGLFEAARAESRLGRLDAEIAAWRLFAAEFPASSRTPEALAALVRALEGRSHTASAAALVRRLAREFPDAEVSDGKDRLKGRDFAERRLRSEAYARLAAAAAPARLAPPLKPAMNFADKEFPESIPLRVGGAPPPGTAGLVFLHLARPAGAAVKAVSLETGRVVWSVPFSTLVRFAAFLEDGLVLADERDVVRIDPRSGGEVRRWTAPSRMRGFALAGATLVFLMPDPRNEAEMTVQALDALSCQPSWSQSFDGFAGPQVHVAGEAVVFTTVQPSRIWMFEADTGRRIGPDQAFPEGLPPQVLHAGPDQLVLLGEGKSIDSYELPTGRLRWRVPMLHATVRAAESGPEGLVLLAMRRRRNGPEEGAYLARVNLKNGKLLGLEEDLGEGDPRYMLCDAEGVYLVSREADGTFRATARGLADFKVRWTSTLGGGREATLLPPSRAAEHLVVTSFEQGADGKYGYAAGILDRSGKEVQYIRSPRDFDRPPVGTLGPSGLIFSVDSRVDVWR